LTAVQYVLADRVVVLIWQRPTEYGRPLVPPRLAGPDPEARYCDDDTGEIHHGAVLLSHGLDPALSGKDHASALIRLTRLT
jgi:alpha-galactosidase